MHAARYLPRLDLIPVSSVRFILVALICASPAILLLDSLIMYGVLAWILTVGIAMMSRTMRPNETDFLVSTIRPIAAIAAIPPAWILIQLLPLAPIAHPIWSSASMALGRPITGSISIDIGAGVLALDEYLIIAAVALLAAAVAVDRERTEWLLFALMGATALIAIIVATNDLFGLAALGDVDAPEGRIQAIDCIAFGVIISIAAGIRTFERYETRQTSPNRSIKLLVTSFIGCGVALSICSAALIFFANGPVMVATSFGVAVLMSVVAIRRLGLGAFGSWAIASLVIGTAILLVANGSQLHTRSLPLAFAAAPASATSLGQRILDDTTWTGTGAGTFAAIASIYRDANDPAAPGASATAAAIFAIELGQPTLWLIVAATVIAIIFLLRASLRRGRDSFYAAAGAACLVVLLFLLFINAGVLGTAAALIAAVTIGVAFAQSKSRPISTAAPLRNDPGRPAGRHHRV